MPSFPIRTFLLATLLLGSACSKHAADTADPGADTTPQYSFPSKFEDGSSSVSYSGSIMRHVLINEMKAHIGALTERIDSGWYPEPGEVTDELAFFFDFSPSIGGSSPLRSVPDNTEQSIFNDVSSEGSLIEKVAGNDGLTGHRDWSTEFRGWEQEGVTDPESLIRTWFTEIDGAALARSNGAVGTSGSIFVSEDGVDRQQLLAKFLAGSVAFYQGAGVLLDDDVDGQGLRSDNMNRADGSSTFTPLEHSWDEGFAYFGANRTYGSMTHDEIVEIGWVDADDNGLIDLGTEFVWGAATTTAKRDLGAIETTQFTEDAWAGLIGGRSIISEADGDLTSDEFAALIEHRDMVVGAWEGAVAATVVHYINDVLQDIETYNTDEYALASVAKHWSEAKGYGLWFQFNPNSHLSDDDFVMLHEALGTAPRLPSAGDETISDWQDDLLDARELLALAFGFDASNVGDETGQNGW